MKTFKEETINNVLMLLNNLDIKGIENAKRIVLITQLLNQTEETADGNNEKV